MYGANNSGKTLFCNCIYNSLHNKDCNDRVKYKIVLDIDNVFEEKLSYSTDNVKGERYTLGVDSFPVCPMNIRVLYLAEKQRLTRDHVSDISKIYNTNEKTILSIMSNKHFKEMSTKRVEIRTIRTKPYLVRKIYISNKKGFLIGLDLCASSEVARFLTDIGIILSRFYSYQSMVLFIIDWSNIAVLDDKNMNELVGQLENNNNLFQSIIVSPDEMPKICWNGWSFARFQNMVPNTIIEQDEF